MTCLSWLAALAAFAVPAAAQEATAAATSSPDAATDAAASGTGAAATDPAPTRTDEITIASDPAGIRLGESVTVRGRREPARGGDLVKVQYRPEGGGWDTVERTRTDARGNYRATATPRHNGRFRAVSSSQSDATVRSRRVGVTVRAKVRIRARAHQLRKRGVRVRGKVRPSLGGRRVTLERQTGKGWERVDATATMSTGSYRFRWDPPALGAYELRTRFRGDDLNRGSRAALEERVNAYREDHASYYGPGFYGNTTACGQTLTRSTVGVAHKRLPCGTKVRFHYRGTTKRVPVIDRGPFIAGRRWDLSNAARRKLNFPKGTDDIWANR